MNSDDNPVLPDKQVWLLVKTSDLLNVFIKCVKCLYKILIPPPFHANTQNSDLKLGKEFPSVPNTTTSGQRANT